MIGASLVAQMERLCLQCRKPEFNPWMRNISWRRKWQPTPVFLSGESHGQRSLVGYSLWGHKESDRTECLALLFRFHSRFTMLCSFQVYNKELLNIYMISILFPYRLLQNILQVPCAIQ